MDAVYLRRQLMRVLPHVGTYNYGGGAIVPAIAIGEVPDNIEVKGTEIVLPKFPYMVENVRTSNIMHSLQEWTICFYMHDMSDTGYEEFFLNVDMMFDVFDKITGMDMPADKKFNTLPGYKFTLTTFRARKTRNPANLNDRAANYGVCLD